MPGISIYLTHSNQNHSHPILDVFPNYRLTNWYDGKLRFCSTTYTDYPIRKIESNDYICIIEGLIYELETDQKVKSICVDLFQNNNNKSLKSFIKNTDGEFIISCIEKQSGRILIFNDYLGRLPFYYYKTDNDFVASREISFITENYNPETSKIASAESLLFGYPLGNRTLHKDCYRMMPSSTLMFEPENNQLLIKELHLINFEACENQITDIKQAANNLHKLFLNACEKRAAGHDKLLLSLSGGLDSRAIMAAFDKLNIDYSMATYKDQAKSADPDIQVVEQLINTSQKQFDLIELEKPDKRHEETLFQMKQGLNYLGMSFILDYFEKIQISGLQFWTGDGGDKVLPDLRPLRMIFSKKDLLHYILNKNKIFSIREVSEIFEIDQKELKQHLLKHIESYPEKTLTGKYTRFSIMERGFKWLFEGEDRNRYYFPSITPFYSVPFFQYAMSIPSYHKKDFKLYKEFLNLLSTEIADFPNANWGLSVNETKKIKWIYTKQSIKSLLPQKGADETEREYYRRTLLMIKE
ncbi:MAG: hypothetical protein JEZ03_00525 [Bacteroidales bacterium]|nr:hypothetical protein [Bacteroidales bacterium]